VVEILFYLNRPDRGSAACYVQSLQRCWSTFRHPVIKENGPEFPVGQELGIRVTTLADPSSHRREYSDEMPQMIPGAAFGFDRANAMIELQVFKAI
jgi:hypothetical protein